MEEDDLVGIITIVIVPVKNGCRLTRSEKHSAHRDRRAEVDFARGRDAAVVEFRKKHARANAKNRLHLIPASERDCIEMILFDIIVDRAGNLS